MAAGIYIHIPFCVRKCKYCDFISGTGTKESMEIYQKALLSEIESTVINETVDSVFLGGGTPSVYPVEYIEEIMDILCRKCNLDLNMKNTEVTIECNPGTLDMGKLQRYRLSGINRISMGLQSADNNELITLGRIHTYEDFTSSFSMAREAGFDNINIDIISAIPGQSFYSYKNTLEKVIGFNPEHISAYSLIIEEGTEFYEKYREGAAMEKELPDEETDRKMYHFTKKILSKNGYERYEISNYAKSGKECKHNIKYWSRDNYYGFGVSAASLVDNVRYTNVNELKKYAGDYGIGENRLNHIRKSCDIVNDKEQMEEYMFLGLRKMKGISVRDFNSTFDNNIEFVYGNVLKKMCSNGLMEYYDGYYKLSDKGIDVSNIVMAEFIF